MSVPAAAPSPAVAVSGCGVFNLPRKPKPPPPGVHCWMPGGFLLACNVTALYRNEMAFVKLSCKMLDSSIWPDKDARDVFITALLMASPYELDKPKAQISVFDLTKTGWSVPAGWYGFIEGAGIGIVNRAMIERKRGMAALQRLCSPEQDSSSIDYDGRRMARVDGGYIILNYMKFRERDETAADRMRRYRKRLEKKNTVSLRNVTHVEAEVDAEAEELSGRERTEGVTTLLARKGVNQSAIDAILENPAIYPANVMMAFSAPRGKDFLDDLCNYPALTTIPQSKIENWSLDGLLVKPFPMEPRPANRIRFKTQ